MNAAATAAFSSRLAVWHRCGLGAALVLAAEVADCFAGAGRAVAAAAAAGQGGLLLGLTSML